MKFSIFLLISLFGVYAIQAQEKEITQIKKRYLEVQSGIEKSTEESGAPYYLNQITLNKNKSNWPAVGIYNEVIDCYYHLEEEDYPNQKVTDKVNVRTLRSAYEENIEYLFDEKGELIFIYFKDMKDLVQEIRFYLTKDKLIGIAVEGNLSYLPKLTQEQKALLESLRAKAMNIKSLMEKL